MDATLSGMQLRNLEAAWGVPVLDRVGLIIEIFAQRARTREARLQASTPGGATASICGHGCGGWLPLTPGVAVAPQRGALPARPMTLEGDAAAHWTLEVQE